MRIRKSQVAVWRRLRWFVAGVPVLAFWACNSPTLLPPSRPPARVVKREFIESSNRKIDLLFMIDNSLSMKGSQEKLTARLPDFVEALAAIPGGLPNLHLAVVSSSLGAGKFGNVSNSSCIGGHPKNDGGAFQAVQHRNCPGLTAGATFIKAGTEARNFTGDLATVFGCVALLGSDGCGFEQQFASVRRALEKASDPNDPDNGGFLRKDAYLAVVMLTNEDDCSVPADSELFDPEQLSLTSPLGEYQSFRCNEFGHLCDGKAPPRDVTVPTTLQNCVPAEEKGRLVPVSEFVTFLKSIKNDPKKVFVAALAGKPGGYVVERAENPITKQVQTSVRHVCSGSTPTEYADPALRVASWIEAFGDHGTLASICDDDYRTSMRQIGDAIGKVLQPSCLPENVRNRSDNNGAPDCQVVSAPLGTEAPAATGTAVPMCTNPRGELPCWELVTDPRCTSGRTLRICRDAACDPANVPSDERSIELSCSID